MRFNNSPAHNKTDAHLFCSINPKFYCEPEEQRKIESAGIMIVFEHVNMTLFCFDLLAADNARIWPVIYTN